MIVTTCFGITLPSSWSVPSTFKEMLNWGAVVRKFWMGVLCLVTWCVSINEYFLEVKAAGVSGWYTYHLHMRAVLKSGSLNLLEPSGPVKACNGIALHLLCWFCISSNTTYMSLTTVYFAPSYMFRPIHMAFFRLLCEEVSYITVK
jgi:hypothetical protein